MKVILMVETIVRKNTYYDSVFLMSVSEEIGRVKGISQVAVLMGTDMNKTVLSDLGLTTPETDEACANDLIIAMDAENKDAIQEGLNRFEQALLGKVASGTMATKYSSLEMAIKNVRGANLAFISVPGEYAGREAKRALLNGLSVFIFSDNVPLEEEIELKRLAMERGLLVMGPGCGTALINGIAVGLMSP